MSQDYFKKIMGNNRLFGRYFDFKSVKFSNSGSVQLDEKEDKYLKIMDWFSKK